MHKIVPAVKCSTNKLYPTMKQNLFWAVSTENCMLTEHPMDAGPLVPKPYFLQPCLLAKKQPKWQGDGFSLLDLQEDT